MFIWIANSGIPRTNAHFDNIFWCIRCFVLIMMKFFVKTYAVAYDPCTYSYINQVHMARTLKPVYHWPLLWTTFLSISLATKTNCHDIVESSVKHHLTHFIHASISRLSIYSMKHPSTCGHTWTDNEQPTVPCLPCKIGGSNWKIEARQGVRPYTL